MRSTTDHIHASAVNASIMKTGAAGDTHSSVQTNDKGALIGKNANNDDNNDMNDYSNDDNNNNNNNNNSTNRSKTRSKEKTNADSNDGSTYHINQTKKNDKDDQSSLSRHIAGLDIFFDADADRREALAQEKVQRTSLLARKNNGSNSGRTRMASIDSVKFRNVLLEKTQASSQDKADAGVSGFATAPRESDDEDEKLMMAGSDAGVRRLVEGRLQDKNTEGKAARGRIRDIAKTQKMKKEKKDIYRNRNGAARGGKEGRKKPNNDERKTVKGRKRK